MLVVAGIVLGLGVPIAMHARDATRDLAVERAEQRAGIVAAALAITVNPKSINLAIATMEADWPDRIGVHGLGPTPLGHSHASAADLRRVAEQATANEQATASEQVTGDDTLPSALVAVDGGLVYLEPVDVGAARPAVVEVFVPDSEVTRGLPTTWWLLGAAGVLLFLAVMLAGDRVATRTAASARRLAAAARALGDGDLNVRVPVQGSREIAEAAVTFNTMADRVAAQLTAERELIADRSHRLRTPLTALRLEVERLGVDGAAHRLAQAVDAMEREVDHVIRTARHTADVPTREQEEHCDAAEVVRERMSFWSAVAEDQSRPFGVFGTAFRAPVPLARSELAAALDALLGNVFRYTPQGTAFEVEVSRRDGYVAVRVDDAGGGIADPKGALRRGVSARGSTGLGLDIVRAAAVAGRGALHIDRGALGGASVVMLLADAQAPRPVPRQRLGFVGRLSREPDERRWGQRTRIGRDFLRSFLSLLSGLSERFRRR